MEDLGYVNPLTKKKSLNKERFLYWISKGAKPSASVHNLLVNEKIIEAKKIAIKMKKVEKPAEAPAVSASPEASAPKEEPKPE